jgi:hypothetical protein
MEFCTFREPTKRRLRLLMPACAIFLLVLSVSFLTTAFHPQPVLATIVNLVVVNVQVHDKKTGKPITDLRAEDFKIEDSGESVRPAYFRIEPPDPVALWVVNDCLRPSELKNRREPPAENGAIIEAALKNLGAQDTVGVAHWCGNHDEAEIDLMPTIDRQMGSAAIVAGQNGIASYQEGRMNLQFVEKAFQLLHANSPVLEQGPLPVFVFLRPDQVYVARNDAERLAEGILSHTTAMAYDVGERNPEHPHALSVVEVSLLPYLSAATGGESISTKMPVGEALQRITAGLRARYLLAWFPPVNPNWHEIKVRLTKAAAARYGEVVLTYRSGYSTKRHPSRYAVTEKTEVPKAESESAALETTATLSEPTISFDADGRTFENTSQHAEFTVRVGDEPLSWSAMPEGNDRSEITVEVAFLSEGGTVFGREVHGFSIVRNKYDGWTRINQQIAFSIVSAIPTGTDHIRFQIRDRATGRTGVFDLPMQKVLDAPKRGMYGRIV